MHQLCSCGCRHACYLFKIKKLQIVFHDEPRANRGKSELLSPRMRIEREALGFLYALRERIIIYHASLFYRAIASFIFVVE